MSNFAYNFWEILNQFKKLKITKNVAFLYPYFTFEREKNILRPYFWPALNAYAPKRYIFLHFAKSKTLFLPISNSLRWELFEIPKKYDIKASYVLITSSILEYVISYSSFSSSEGYLTRLVLTGGLLLLRYGEPGGDRGSCGGRRRGRPCSGGRCSTGGRWRCRRCTLGSS